MDYSASPERISVLIQDTDQEYDPSDYRKLRKPIIADKADVVFGLRFVGTEAHRVLSLK